MGLNMKFGLNLTILLFLICFNSFAQKEGLNWYFGRYAGLKFHNGHPEPTTGALSTTEGCATISDQNGNLQFYTDGITVYNKEHGIMQNGHNLYGDPSSTQSGVIVPVPDNPNMYYIFTVSNLDKKGDGLGFRYSTVNMQLDDSLGGVTEKNILLFESTTERITSVKHDNDYGIWVIGHEWESSRFRSYLITPDGINTSNPVISDVGVYHGDSLLFGKGYMKVSPEGNKLAVCIQGMDLIQVFDFDNETGIISNPIDLPGVEQPYGVEFSREADLLYASERYSTYIYQWNLLVGSPTAIANSKTIVGEFLEPSSLGGALQMASDGKIYIAIKNKKYLAAITKPDELGVGCEFEENAVWLNNNRCEWGLPTFIQSYFNNLWIIRDNECVGEEILFSLNDPENIDSVKWDFGDPMSGINNTSHLFEPVHIYLEPGSYRVELIVYYLDVEDTISTQISIFEEPSVDLGEDLDICEGDSVQLFASGYFTECNWLDNILLNSNFLTVKEDGYFWVDVATVCGLDQDTVYVSVRPLPEVDLGRDTFIEYNSNITLSAPPGYFSYIWQDSSTFSEYNTEIPGTFWVEVSDDIGCKSSDTIFIEPLYIDIHVPTAFSPNGDNLNEIFAPISAYEITMDYELMIFNRFGELVFISNDFKFGWDGSYNGNPCPIEVYTWFLKAEPKNISTYFSKQIKLSGNVTLLR